MHFRRLLHPEGVWKLVWYGHRQLMLERLRGGGEGKGCFPAGKKQKHSGDHRILLCWEEAVTPSQNGYRLKEITRVTLPDSQDGKPTNGLEIARGVSFQDSVLDTASALH